MTPPEADLMTTCPGDVEELAAFIDGRLTSERRARVVEHLATCADCRDIVMIADEFAVAEGAVAEGSATSNVVRGKFFQRVAIPAAAAAAIMTGLFLGPFGKSGMERLVADSEKLDKRPVAARFSADFPYKDHEVLRTGSQEREFTVVDAEAWKLAEKAQKNPTAKNLHAAGVAYLHLGREEGDAAVKSLEHAVAKSPHDAAILTDLAAAYLAVDDAERALKTADRALAIEKTPAALWNRAYALQRLRRVPQARAAWDAYLQIDPSSEWAKEVREKHLQYLE